MAVEAVGAQWNLVAGTVLRYPGIHMLGHLEGAASGHGRHKHFLLAIELLCYASLWEVPSMSISHRILTGAATAAVIFVAMSLLAAAPPGGTTIYVDDDTCPHEGSGTEPDPYCPFPTAIDNALD